MAGGAERFEGIGQGAGRDAGCGRRVPVVVLQQGGYGEGFGLFGVLYYGAHIYNISIIVGLENMS